MVLPEPTDKVFPQGGQLKLFNRILAKAKLKADRDGKPRTAYSLRHTYICLRLMEGADIYQIAKNCRTSVEMIEKHYAAHIKNTLDAAAINVMRPKAARQAEKQAKAVTNGRGKRQGAQQADHSGKARRTEKAVPERRAEAREAGLRVTDADLVPGALTEENNL